MLAVSFDGFGDTDWAAGYGACPVGEEGRTVHIIRILLAALIAVTLAATAASQPPPNETFEQRTARYAAWVAAKAQASLPLADLRAKSGALTQTVRAEAASKFETAFLLWQEGQYRAAEIGFRSGLEIDPADIPANYYLGNILQRTRREAEASTFLTRASKLGPSSREGLLAAAALLDLQSAGGDARQVLWDCAACPEMVVIPAGSFTMGSTSSESGLYSGESPQRRVIVPAFAAGKYEVTWAEWDRCVADGGCASLTSDGFGGGSRPVTKVSWNEAQTYARWLSNKTGQTYRLLSEAEWEYAARAGTMTAYPWGSSASDQYANFGKDSCCDGLASGRDQWVNTAPVGSFDENAFGLHDMHGNVEEWVQDCYEYSYSHGQPSDGSAFTTGSCSERAVRGGGYIGYLTSRRSASRDSWAPASRHSMTGFRLARTL